MSDGETDDLELVRRTAAGDDEAFDRLVARHRSAVWRYVRSLSSNEGDAEDALQETFLSVWRAAGGFRGHASVKAWIFAIARNAVYRQFRGQSARVDEVPLADLGSEAGWGDRALPYESLNRDEQRILFSQAIEALSAVDREVLLVRDVEGFSGDETAALLGLTLPAMKTRLHRARLRFTAEARRRRTDA